jgi:hypothetical protein
MGMRSRGEDPGAKGDSELARWGIGNGERAMEGGGAGQGGWLQNIFFFRKILLNIKQDHKASHYKEGVMLQMINLHM